MKVLEGRLSGDIRLESLRKARRAARVAELNAELAAIYRTFPDLRRGTGGAKVSRRRRRKPMSAAQKAAVSKRMKKYWAARKAKKVATGHGDKRILFIPR
jgi:hypothetical protein